MKEIENAYRILELTVGASFKEVSEAREDLLILWDSERLAHHPRLRSRSAGKIQQINQAYETLIEYLGRSEVGRGSRPIAASAPTRVRIPTDSAQSSESPGTEQPSTSLFEEVFSGGEPQPSRRIPVWLIVVLVTTAVLAIGYVAQSTRGEKQQNQQKTDSDLLPQPLEDSGPARDPGLEVPTWDSENPDQPGAAPDPSSGENESAEAQTPDAQQRVSLSSPETPGKKPAATTPKPAPPPKPAPKTTPKKKSAGSGSPASKSGRPVLVRQKTDPDSPAPVAQLEEERAEEKQRKEEAERAYQLLLKKSATAKKLVAGEFQQRFAEWKVINQKPPEVWIDIIAKQAGGELVHFIWSVNLKTEAIRPLSEAARNPGKGK